MKTQCVQKSPLKSFLILASLGFFLLSCQKVERREEKYSNGQIKKLWNVIKDKNDNYVKHGGEFSWYLNGKKRLEARYENGRQQGLQREYYVNGEKLSYSHWKDGKKHGVSVGWFPNGVKAFERYFEKGVSSGYYREWTIRGVKRREWKYNKEGKRHGGATLWKEDGKIDTTFLFSNGELVRLSLGGRSGSKVRTTPSAPPTYIAPITFKSRGVQVVVGGSVLAVASVKKVRCKINSYLKEVDCDVVLVPKRSGRMFFAFKSYDGDGVQIKSAVGTGTTRFDAGNPAKVDFWLGKHAKKALVYKR